MTEYQYRLSMGLCSCGEKVAPGRTLCYRCAQINAVKAKERYRHLTDEQKKAKTEYMREYMKKPEQQKRVKERGKYYQQRYHKRNIYENGYPWEGEE